MPHTPGVSQGPGGMPIRPGFNGGRPGQKPPMLEKPGAGKALNQGAPRGPQKVPASKAAAPDSVKKNSIVFYSCYFGFIFLFFVITFFGLTWLKGWLTDYEASQPYTMADQIFQDYFVDPNWKLIYQNSTAYATNPDDCDVYVAQMEEKVGNSQLTYQETSAGLSGDKKYFIKLGDERIASFTLVGDSQFITDIPDWTLGEIEVMVKYDHSYRIEMLEGHTAFVNGKALDESHTIMKASTMAQEFLPVGTKGIRMWTQQVDNLMGKPQVVIKDEKGQEMQVTYDGETHTFIEQTKVNTITDAQRDAAVGAAKVYGRYMIGQAGRGELAKFFDSSSKIYASIRDSEKIIQASFFSSYDFGEAEILNFSMYSDDLFSARVSVDLNVTRKDGTLKLFPIETTLFFSQHSTGKWLAYDMTNEDVQKPVGQVRITFNGADGTRIASDFYDTNATELDTPMITVPEGKVFSGWVRENVSDEGKKVLEVVFTPDETGHVTLSGNTGLEPMVLTPLFENASAEGGA